MVFKFKSKFIPSAPTRQSLAPAAAPPPQPAPAKAPPAASKPVASTKPDPSRVKPAASHGSTASLTSETTASLATSYSDLDLSISASLSRSPEAADEFATSAESVVGSEQKHLHHEDACATLKTKIGGERVVLCLVADGHGGARASTHCGKAGLALVVKHAGEDASSASLTKACEAAFKQLHEDVRAGRDGTGDKICTSGATLTICAVNEDRRELVCANVGDSHAALLRTGSPSVCTIISEDHRLDNSEAERERVTSLGAIVGRATDQTGIPRGPLRAWPGGLALARSIGDSDAGAVISCTPAVHTCKLGDAAAALIVASDGVWDAIEAPRVGRIVRSKRDPSNAAAAVVAKSIITVHQRRGTSAAYLSPVDDTTCVVVRFPPRDSLSTSSHREPSVAKSESGGRLSRSRSLNSLISAGEGSGSKLSRSFREMVNTPR